MNLPKRDAIATVLVAAAGILYMLWAIGSALPGMSSTRATGVAVLALGFAASASAVVPAFGRLVRGSKTYLAITSVIGLAAAAAGVQMLITASGTGLTVVIAAMAVLWLIATIRHRLLAKTGLVSQQFVEQQPMRQWPGSARAAVVHAAEFRVGAHASCLDGYCGEVCRVIVNPVTDRVTQLVVRQGHRRRGERLVPVGLVDIVDAPGGGIRLRCTLTEFDQLDRAAKRELVQGMEGVGTGGFLGDQMDYEVGGKVYAVGSAGELIGVGPMPEHRRMIVADVVPPGEAEVGPGGRVHPVDGEMGRVEGFLADPRAPVG